jgi:hypothetical protein
MVIRKVISPFYQMERTRIFCLTKKMGGDIELETSIPSTAMR